MLVLIIELLACKYTDWRTPWPLRHVDQEDLLVRRGGNFSVFDENQCVAYSLWSLGVGIG
jgi:hypothetical protein